MEHPVERINRLPEASEEVHRILGHLGLVDALRDAQETPQHVDELWAVQNPNIVLGED